MAGLLWERQIEKILLEENRERVPGWECFFLHDDMWREVIRPDGQTYSAQNLRGSSVLLYCRGSLRECAHRGASIRRMVVDVHVDAVVSRAMTDTTLCLYFLCIETQATWLRVDKMTPHQCWNVCDWDTTEKDKTSEAQLSLPTCTQRKPGKPNLPTVAITLFEKRYTSSFQPSEPFTTQLLERFTKRLHGAICSGPKRPSFSRSLCAFRLRRGTLLPGQASPASPEDTASADAVVTLCSAIPRGRASPTAFATVASSWQVVSSAPGQEDPASPEDLRLQVLSWYCTVRSQEAELHQQALRRLQRRCWSCLLLRATKTPLHLLRSLRPQEAELQQQNLRLLPLRQC